MPTRFSEDDAQEEGAMLNRPIAEIVTMDSYWGNTRWEYSPIPVLDPDQLAAAYAALPPIHPPAVSINFLYIIYINMLITFQLTGTCSQLQKSK